MRKRTQAREFALQILYQVDLLQSKTEEIFKDFWVENEVDQEVRDYTVLIVNGTLKHQKAIDESITKYAENWQLERMAVVDRNVLRLATFELLYLDEMPPKVAINEAVNLAKKFSQIEAGKFVNGILDKIAHTEAKRVQSQVKKPSGN